MHLDTRHRVGGPALLVALTLAVSGCGDTRVPLDPEVDPAAPPGDCRTSAGSATLPAPARPSSCWQADDVRLRRTSDCRDVSGAC